MRHLLPSVLQGQLERGELRAYVVARPSVLASLDLAPGGVAVGSEHQIDPTRADTTPFLDRIERIDHVVFAPRGLATPRWALYDCACLPGVIFGLGRPSGSTARDLVPLSSLVAIPMLGDDRWLAYALAVAPMAEPIPRLGEATLALGIALLRAREITTTAQWASPELATFASVGPLRLLAAWSPAHDVPGTAVLRFDAAIDDVAPDVASARPNTRAATDTVDAHDPEALRALQRDIEAGAVLHVVGPPFLDGSALRVPLHRARPA